MDDPLIIVDNLNSVIKFNGSRWVERESPNTFGGSQHLCDMGPASDTGKKDLNNLTFPFHGKSVEVYGTLDRSLSMVTTLNRGNYNPVDETGNAPSGQGNVKLFEASIIAGSHSIYLEPLHGVLSIDYILFSPVGQTNFTGTDLIFDDTHPSVNYTGTWVSTTPTQLPQFSYNKTLMSTTERGASFAFAFTGSSVSVYGGFQDKTGVVAAEYTVDGQGSGTEVLANRTEAPDAWSLHQRFFHYEVTERPEQMHILNVTVREASEDQPFLLDYIIVQGNEHTDLKEPTFKKSGSELKEANLRIGLVIMAVILLIMIWVAWLMYRKRRRAKGAAQRNMIPVKLQERGMSH